MRPEIEGLKQKTLELVGSLENVLEEQLVEFVEYREAVAELVLKDGSISAEERQTFRELSRYDHAIVARMERLRDEAADGLRKLNQSRIQRSMYTYQAEPDSYFINRYK